ncbi:MAG TPA: hypothetical protein V6D15_19220 [Oculatellaceae cyanobacterium]|jgi:hypothetical protein
MKELCYTLVSDGSSDKALLSVLTWLLQINLINCAIQPSWADFRHLPNRPKTLPCKIKAALELAPCNLLFVHRDAEKEPHHKRIEEIRQAIQELREFVSVPYVCVIPVHMTEAWFLFDEAALRRAANNPHGRQELQFPPITKLEQLPNPKHDLHQLLITASGLTGRRLKQFRVHECVHRVAENIDDFSPLRALPAFNALEAEIKKVIQEQGWCSNSNVK